jgi:hypothetical protein
MPTHSNTPTLNPQDEPGWRRRLGTGANNRCWTLTEQPARTAEEDQEMLNAAHAAVYLWSTIGNAQNFALGELLLGQVHALLGNSGYATKYAKSAHDYFSGKDNAAQWELALSHAVLANAAHLACDLALHQARYQSARDMIENLADPEEKKSAWPLCGWCQNPPTDQTSFPPLSSCSPISTPRSWHHSCRHQHPLPQCL